MIVKTGDNITSKRHLSISGIVRNRKYQEPYVKDFQPKFADPRDWNGLNIVQINIQTLW